MNYEDLIADYLERVDRGEHSDPREYILRHPRHADRLQRFFANLGVMNGVVEKVVPKQISESKVASAGKTIGDFRIMRELGRGGMGIVYEAEQLSTERRVALKTLPLAGLVDESRIKRFRNEVRAVAALDHPNIVAVYTVGEERGIHYYAMQLIRGRPLSEVISSLKLSRDDGRRVDGASVSLAASVSAESEANAQTDQTEAFDSGLPSKAVAQADTAKQFDSTLSNSTGTEYFRSVVGLGIQAATALQHAHDQGVIHRDIKPANLLLDASSKLYVTDFGLARIEADAGVTMTGDVLGTLRYMAPEQALAKRVVIDHRADIYSLGVTLYELLSLQPAYAAEDRQQLLKQIAFEEAKPLRRVNPRIPSELETIVQKAMSKDMDQRYTSCELMAEDLRCFLDHRPITAKPTTSLQVIQKWTRRNPTIMWATLITMLLAALVFGVSTLIVLRQRDELVDAKAKTEEQLHLTTLTRLAAESRVQQNERPILAALLAVEAVEVSQRRDGTMLPIAHEALLNSTQHLRKGLRLSGHSTKISGLKMTSDWLITHSEDEQQAHLWDLSATKPELSSISLANDGEAITSIAVSDGGRWLATGGSKLRRWDLSFPAPQASPLVLPNKGAATVLGMSRDGRWLVAHSDGAIKCWDCLDASRGPQIVWRTAEAPFSHAMSADGKWFAASDGEGPLSLVGLSGDHPGEPQLLPREDNLVYGRVIMSPDGRSLVAELRGERIFRMWDLEADDPSTSPRTIRATTQSDSLDTLQMSGDSNSLFAGTNFGARLHRWRLDVADVESTHSVLGGHTNQIVAMSPTRDGRWFLSAGLNGTVQLWDLSDPDSPRSALSVRAHDEIRTAVVHPEGKWFATAGADGVARLWSFGSNSSGSPPLVLHNQPDDIFSSSAISSSGRMIATTVNPNAIQIWTVNDEAMTSTSQILEGPENRISAIAISRDDRWLVAGSQNSLAFVWDLTSDNVAASMKVLGTPVSADGKGNGTGLVAIGHSSRWLALASGDFGIRIWDLTATDINESSRILTGHDDRISSLVFSKDGRWLVTAARSDQRGETVRIWNLTSNQTFPSYPLKSGDSTVWNCSMSIDSNSRWLATNGANFTTQLWDLQADDPSSSPRILAAVGDREGNGGANAWRIILSPDARWLFTSRFDRTAQLWDLSKEPAKLTKLQGHYGVQDAVISPDGHWLAMGNRDSGNARLWDLTAPNPAASVRVLRGHKEVVWSVGFSADSRWLITDASDGTIRRWCLDTEWLLNYAREVAGRQLTDTERALFGLQR